MILNTEFENTIRQHIEIFNSINDGEINRLIKTFCDLSKTNRVIGLGAGRMGYSLRSFIMRLSHIGFHAYMIGDTSLPRVAQNDLVLINSSSGNTPSIALYAKQAKEAGAQIILLTASIDSSIEKISNQVIRYKVTNDMQLMKTVHEQFSMLLFDHIAHRIVEDAKIDISFIEHNHSILE